MDYIPQEVGIFNTLISVIFSVVILRIFYSFSLGFGSAVERLSLERLFTLKKSKKKVSKSPVLALFIAILLVPIASGHAIHFTEEGEGFDAPKRYLIDVNETYVWVEFMIWPPKALIDTEVVVLPASNETANIEDAWIEVVYPTEKDEVRMRTDLASSNNISIWDGQVVFPFSGNQTIQIWLEVDGQSSFTEIPVDVEGPPLLPVWLAWAIAISWPVAMVLIWKNISHKII